MKYTRGIALFALFAIVAPSALAMDRVRVETHTNQAVAKFGVTGRGVVVALIDRGIDWLNQDFRNDDGTTRIAYIFDMGDDTGAHAPGNPYGFGTIYTRAQIDAALAGGPALPTRDALGHGTTTAAIAAGNGRGLPDRRYRGIAPDATIIAVKITGGAPAHDDQAAEPGFYLGDAKIVTAIDFVRAKARELGMPAVMLANVGSQQGPTDGTSALARGIDAAVGPGIPGLVFVTGPGDDGGTPNRCGGTVAAGATAAIQIQKGDGALRFDLWYSEQDRFDVSVDTPAGSRGPYPSPASASATVVRTEPEFVMRHLGADAEPFGATSPKRELLIDFSGPAGTYTVNLVGQTVVDGRFDGIINPATFSGSAAANKFLTFVAPGSIWDGASARNNICPGDYVIRNNWIDIDGASRSLTGEGVPGELWRGSSVGPTFDGRLGVDVVAPGNSLFTTYNTKSYYATFRFNLIQDGMGLYGRASAVSAAAPSVTGIIALMLEMDPSLDAAEVKAILQRTARRDRFTGSAPSPEWGYGKVDAFGALAALESGTPPTILKLKVNLTKSSVAATGSGFVGAVEVFADGFAFASPSKVKGGTKVTQKGVLANGMTLSQYVSPGQTVTFYFRNAQGGTATASYTR
jgi:hypothetical protein